MRIPKQKPIGNLPTALSTFIDRTHKIDNVKKLVSTHRLITLTCAGGSVKTVETYVTRILNKLGFDSRVQIATWVTENRIASLVNGMGNQS